jgi:uncharacterized protein (DUF2461 family)
MLMATIEILGWKEHDVGFTGWDGHARAELMKRLRRAINASPSKLKSMAREIRSRHCITLHNVQDDTIASVRQTLETMGAELHVSPTPKKL